MTIESDVFKRASLDEAKLIPYGFKKQNNKYIYSKNILDNAFRIDITIKNAVISGKITDLSFNEEYTNFRIETKNGGFSSEIRKEFINLLEDIKLNCYSKKYFISNQANRIAGWIKEKYSNLPEFLWEKFPGYGIFRLKSDENKIAELSNLIIESHNYTEK